MITNLIKQLFNLVEAELLEQERNHYAELELQYLKLNRSYKEINDKHNKSEQELREEIIKLTEKKEQADKRIQELLKKDVVDILSLKEWYEGKRDKLAWFYNGRRLGTTDVRHYLQTRDIEPFILLAHEIIIKYNLAEDNTPTEIITAMYRYWNLKSSWTYKTDQELHNQIEWWEDPVDAIETRVGDCETKAKCMYWTGIQLLSLLGYEAHHWRLTFVASIVTGEGGHAFNTWLDDDGEYYVIESTYDNEASKKRTWLKTPVRNNNMYKSFWGFATYYKSWRGNNSEILHFKDFI